MSAFRKLSIKTILGSNMLAKAMLVSGPVTANDFTAEKVMTEMEGAERYAFVAGVVEGLAVARYNKDGKQKQGMECIYDWFYNDKKTKDLIYIAFDKFGDYPPASVVDILAKRKCGE